MAIINRNNLPVVGLSYPGNIITKNGAACATYLVLNKWVTLKLEARISIPAINKKIKTGLLRFSHPCQAELKIK